MKRKFKYFRIENVDFKIRFYDFGNYWIGKWKSFKPKNLDDYNNFVDVRSIYIENYKINIQLLFINPLTNKKMREECYFLYVYSKDFICEFPDGSIYPILKEHLYV